MSGVISSKQTSTDQTGNLGGEVAAEDHFEDSSLKTAISDI
jgi:hypothetical protein